MFTYSCSTQQIWPLYQEVAKYETEAVLKGPEADHDDQRVAQRHFGYSWSWGRGVSETDKQI